MKKQKLVKISIRKLGQYKALGRYLKAGEQGSSDVIEIDPLQSPREFLSTAIHEAIHLGCPYLEELEVVRVEKVICEILWTLNYRRTSQ